MISTEPIADPVYRVLYSKEHKFLYHPNFHPGLERTVASIGWRAVVECSFNGQSKSAEAILGLNQEGVESIAKDFAFSACQRGTYGCSNVKAKKYVSIAKNLPSQ